jgi:hypothetical protein
MPCRVFTPPGPGAESGVNGVLGIGRGAGPFRFQTEQFIVSGPFDAVSYLSRPARIALVFRSCFAGGSRVQYHKLLL